MILKSTKATALLHTLRRCAGTVLARCTGALSRPSLKSRISLAQSDGTPVDKDTIGRWGEHLAARWLTKNGRKVLYHNFRAPRGGEVDIVARHGDTLTFCEVKTRTSTAWGRPGEAVNEQKKLLILRGAHAWLKMLHNPNIITRCDVIEVVLRDGELPNIQIVEGAFRLDN